MKKTIIYCLCGMSMVLSSCQEKGWGVEGKIENAPDGAKVAVEGLNAGHWYNIDSVEVAADGTFKYRAEAGSPYPDIYRVSLDGRAIYFPIDSIDNVTITANATNFDRDYTLSGSALAESMMAVDKKIADFVAANGVQAALTDSVFKRDISATINNDESGILAYYLINKTIGDQPLFSAASRYDVRMLGAIANKFMTMFPDDPRTEYLKQRYLQARRALPDAKRTVVGANETGLIDLTFYDVQGRARKLSDMAGNGGVTLLSFTSYNIEPSVAYNVELNRLLDKYRDNGVQIYQIAIDDNEVQWRENARNLPWTAVRANPEEVNSMLSIYNIGVIPTTFVIDRNGDLVERIDGDPAAIESALRKHL